MNKNIDRAMRGLVLGAAVVGLSGCASYPISKTLRREAKPVTLAQVTANPSACKGTIVVWGGRIIQTVNDTNGGSLYVLKLPFHRDGRPMSYAVSPGRFIARSEGFLDPAVYKRGRLVTVAGTIAGVETEPLQKIHYAYPVVAIEELHVWHRRPHYYYYYPYWYYRYPYWGWYGPGWGWYGPVLDYDEGEHFEHEGHFDRGNDSDRDRGR